MQLSGFSRCRPARTLLFAASFVAAAALSAATGFAQGAANYPNKPIRIIVPFPPGGSVELVARFVGQKLTEAWGQTVVVETRPGAATIIGTQAAAQAEPDGYTLVVVVSNHATNPSLRATMPYDALEDFQFVSLLARVPMIPYANPKFEAADLKQLIAVAKAKPGSISFGSAGPGSMTHLVAEMLKIQAGIDMTHVVYRGGTPAMQDAIAGHIQMTFGTVTQAIGQVKAGALRALGVTSAERYRAVPDVPTFKEQGIDLVASEWFVLLAPGKTPRPIVDKLNAEIRRMMNSPDGGERLATLELLSSTPEEAKAFVRGEIERWRPVIKQLGLKLE